MSVTGESAEKENVDIVTRLNDEPTNTTRPSVSGISASQLIQAKVDQHRLNTARHRPQISMPEAQLSLLAGADANGVAGIMSPPIMTSRNKGPEIEVVTGSSLAIPIKKSKTIIKENVDASQAGSSEENQSQSKHRVRFSDTALISNDGDISQSQRIECTHNPASPTDSSPTTNLPMAKYKNFTPAFSNNLSQTQRVPQGAGSQSNQDTALLEKKIDEIRKEMVQVTS